MKRRDFIKTTGGLIAAAAGTPWAGILAGDALGNAAGNRFNVLFLTADDMNATMPGWMGNPLKPTPNMDALAGTCHRFVNNRAAAPICQPSREAMMTGRVPHRSGGYGFNPIRAGIPTLVTVLKAAGYFTAGFNKITHMAPPGSFPWDMQRDGSGKNPAEVGKDVADGIKSARDAGKPFFINCNITDPHRPFYGAAQKGGKNPENLPHEFAPGAVTVPSFLEDVPGVRKEISQYYNSVQRLDVSIGKALDALKASGQENRTLVLFVSDHGMPFPFAKATLYHNGPWCPVILRWPGMGSPKAYDEMTSSTDIMPTLLDLLGVPKPEGMDGRSWATLFNGGQQPDRDYVVSHVNSLSSGMPFPQRLVQTKNSALIFSPWSDGKTRFRCESMSGLTFKALLAAGKTDSRIRARIDQYLVGYLLAFYDLEKDPDQRTNALDDPKHRAEIDRLKQILLGEMTKTEDPLLGCFKTVLAGGKADIRSVEKWMLQEEKSLRHGTTSGENS